MRYYSAQIYNSDSDVTIDVDLRNIISLDVSRFDRADIDLPSWGIIANKGNISFRDYENNGHKEWVLWNIQQLYLKTPSQIKIYLNSTTSGVQTRVATMQTDKWEYDEESKAFSVSLKDDLEEWQDIYIEGFLYDPRNPKSVLASKNMGDLYIWLHKRTPSKYQMLAKGELDSSTISILENTVIPYPFLKDGSLWAQWTKLCQICRLHIYKNSQGRTVCAYNTEG